MTDKKTWAESYEHMKNTEPLIRKALAIMIAKPQAEMTEPEKILMEFTQNLVTTLDSFQAFIDMLDSQAGRMRRQE